MKIQEHQPLYQTSGANPGSEELRCRVIRTFDDVAAVADQWESLVDQSEFSDVFATLRFARAWWSAYGKENHLHLVLVEDGSSNVRLIAPFYATVSAPKILRIIGDPRADYNSVISAKGDTAPVETLCAWLRQHSSWRICRFQNLPSESPFTQYFGRASDRTASQTQRIREWIATRAPLTYLSWQQNHPFMNREKLEELGGLFPGSHDRRKLNSLSRMGTIKYRCVKDTRECIAILPVLAKMHVAEWNSRGQESVFQAGETLTFYETLIGQLAPSGAIRFDVLVLKDEIIAAHFGFTWAGRVYYYKASFLTQFIKQSPGKLLLGFIMKEALASGLRELDMLMGLDEYKAQYASGIRATGCLRMYRSPQDMFSERLAWILNLAPHRLAFWQNAYRKILRRRAFSQTAGNPS